MTFEGFLQGGCSLKEIELGQVGEVGGKSLLHLQCHFGLDTLSWARRGARVTGVDLSDESIKRASELIGGEGLSRRLIFSVLMFTAFQDLSQMQKYDLVYVSYGALELAS